MSEKPKTFTQARQQLRFEIADAAVEHFRDTGVCLFCSVDRAGHEDICPVGQYLALEPAAIAAAQDDVLFI